jgi:hypothetical protein
MEGEAEGEASGWWHIVGVVEGEGATGLDEIEGWLDSEGLDELDAIDD